MAQIADGQTDFPIPEFDPAEVTFGAQENRYLTRETMGDEFYCMRGPYCDAASMLFYNGGKLEDHGLRLKPGIDQRKAYTAIRAWLGSWAPKHEIKIGTVGYALSKWCDIVVGSSK